MAVDRETGKIAGYLNGLVTDESTLRDEFFKQTDLHDPRGANVMILSLGVLPQYRRQGLASELMACYVQAGAGAWPQDACSDLSGGKGGNVPEDGI